MRREDDPPGLTTPPRKAAQLVGDLDREYTPPMPTLNLTQTRVGLVGNDCGHSFLHKGKLYFVFGDTVPVVSTPSRPFNADSIAIAGFDPTDPAFDPASLDKGIPLDFLTDTDGLYLPVRLDGHPLLTNSLPMTGFSDDVTMHVFFALAGQRSVLGASTDDGHSFSSVATVPTKKMVNIFPLRVTTSSVRGLGAPWSGDTLLIWGRPARPGGITYDPTGDPIYVAAASFDAPGDPSTWLYYGGSSGVAPRWVTDEAAAVPIVEPNVPSQCNGSFSVTWLPGLDHWLMLARCDGPKQILYRVASDVLGPWSSERVFFDPQQDGGSCRYMHIPGCDTDVQPTTLDPHGVPTWGPDQPAYPYAPYVLAPTVRWNASSDALTFTMLISVWNPYSPMVMKVQLVPADVE